MDSYTKIPIWKTKRRIRVLKEFLRLVNEYFNNAKQHYMVDNAIENEVAKSARSKINLKIDEVRKIVIQAHVAYVVRYTPPPVVGGPITSIDLFHNLHQLSKFHIPVSHLVDVIERAIGVYETDLCSAWSRTLNPFYWLGAVFEVVASVPFRLLASAGFNQEAAEESALGKIFKAIIYAVGALASALTVIQLLGYLEVFNVFWHKIFGI